MLRIFRLLLIVLLIAGCSPSVVYTDEIEDHLKSLDDLIANKELIQGQKDRRIASLRTKIGTSTTGRQLYDVYDSLFDEYFQYNIDSTILYAWRKIDLSKEIGDPVLMKDAVIDLAERYNMSGLYEATLNLLGEYDFKWDTDPRYLSILNTIYSNLEITSNDPVLSQKYKAKKDATRRQMLDNLDENDISRIYIEADILWDQNNNQALLDLVLPWLKANEPQTGAKGVIYYVVARAYNALGDTENAIIWYAMSATDDLLVPKYEYRSLYELARILYEQNDIKRAYTYITRSVEDALHSNAQLHKQFSYQLLPVISQSYDKSVTQKNNAILLAFIILVILFVIIIIMYIILSKERTYVMIAEKQTKESNMQLKKLTEELKDNVRILQETHMVKDLYLGRYLNMCSDYIDGLEKYRTSLRKVLKDGGDIVSALKSKEFMEKALDDFYSQFDATFLDLFPDFIDQLNELLQEDKRITDHPHKDRLLSTELRILALIRLGVDDSVKIASFLRRSVSTVYNYRVKMRNSALCDREDFENRVMNIGTRR